MMYYRIVFDSQKDDAWFIHGPFEQNGSLVDDQFFRTCLIYSDFRSELRYRIRHNGESTSFTFASFDVPVINDQISHVFLECNPKDIQLISVKIEGKVGQYWILNVLKEVSCLDEKNSTIMWWKPEDGRPDKVGQYRMITKFKLDRQRIGDTRIFRLGGWKVALIVNDQLKQKLEQAGISGVRFEEMET